LKKEPFESSESESVRDFFFRYAQEKYNVTPSTSLIERMLRKRELTKSDVQWLIEKSAKGCTQWRKPVQINEDTMEDAWISYFPDDPAFHSEEGESLPDFFVRYAQEKYSVVIESSLIQRMLSRRELTTVHAVSLIERCRDVCRLMRRPMEINDEIMSAVWRGTFREDDDLFD